MKRIYVAGAYSADNVLDVLKNIGMGEQICSDLFSMGYAPFCPWHDKGYVISDPYRSYTVQQFYDYSIAWLKVSDAMFLVRGWEDSTGTLAEIAVANKLGIRQFMHYSELEKWREEND